MKALIIKDFLLLQKQLKIMIGVLVLYAVLFVPQGMMDMIAFMLVMFAALYVMTSMSFDETLKWDSYALSSHVTRRNIVDAKYMFTFLLLLGAFTLGLLSYIITPLFVPVQRQFATSLFILAGICFAGLLWISLMLPLMFKQGVEKSRLMQVGAVMLPVAAVVLYERYAPPELTAFFIRYMAYIPLLLMLLAVAAFFLSYKISINIYNKKEF